MVIRPISRAGIKRSKAIAAIALSISLALSASAGLLLSAPVPAVVAATPITQGIQAAGITRVGVATFAGTAVTPPAHSAGNIMVIAAFRSGSTTHATVPATGGWVTILTKSGTGCSMVVAYKICTGTSDASGTWTNATELVCHIYAAGAGNTLGIGASASSSSTSLTVTYPALTMADGSGNSWVAGFAGVTNTSQTITTAPTGLTNESSIPGASSAAAGFDTTAGVSTWSSANATNTGTAGDSVSCTIEILLLSNSNGSNYANVYGHIGGGTNPNQNGGGQATSTSYTLPLPLGYMGSGNCGVLWLTVDNGTTPSVSDNVNGSWGAAYVSATSTGNQDVFCFVLPNMTAAGSTKPVITVSLVSATLSFQWTYTELYGMATSSVTAGSHDSIATAGPSLAAGSFTPTANNCVILTYASKCVSLNGQAKVPSRIVAGSGFTLLDACMAENSAPYSDAHASEIFVQGTAAAVNGGFSFVGDTDTYTTVAVALKTSPGAGTAPTTGIFTSRTQSFTTEAFPASGTWVTQASFLGNCRAICCDDPALNSLTITDSEGNTWLQQTAGTGWWYLDTAHGAQVNPNLMIYITGGGGDTKVSWRAFDTSGTANTAIDAGGCVAITNGTIGAVTSFTMTPNPSPTGAAGLLYYNIGLGTGPGLGITAPAAAAWLMPNYTGENDFDFMGNADICAQYKYTSSGAVTSAFSITSQTGNSTSGGTIAFLQAPVSTVVAPVFFPQPRLLYFPP